MMKRERLSKTDLKIFAAILPGEQAVGKIAEAIGRSPSHISERIRHLRDMGLVETRKNGLSVFIRISPSPVAAALALLMKEGSGLDLSKVLTGPGLTLLPYLLAPGSVTRELMKRTSLSQVTVRGSIRRWRGMGIVVRERGTGRYLLATDQRELADFTAKYMEDSVRRSLGKHIHGAVLVWHDRDEFLFSVDPGVHVSGYALAGPGALKALGYDIAHSREYYAGGRASGKVSKEEALAQALYIERENPRIIRWVLVGIKDRRLSRKKLLSFARKYGLEDQMRVILEGIGGH